MNKGWMVARQQTGRPATAESRGEDTFYAGRKELSRYIEEGKNQGRIKKLGSFNGLCFPTYVAGSPREEEIGFTHKEATPPPNTYK